MIQDPQTKNVPKLPDGFTMRPAVMGDLEAVVEMLNIWSRDSEGRDAFDLALTRMEWTEPKVNPETDFRIVEDSNGNIVGYVEVWMTSSPPVRPSVWGRVHPQYIGRGIGTFMMTWAEGRVHDAIDLCPPDVRITYRCSTKQGIKPAEDLLTDFGMKVNRHFYTMLIELDSEVQPSNVPEGILIREYEHPDELESVIRAYTESFRDHWGYIEHPFEETLDEWMHLTKTDQAFDPKLWFLAIDRGTNEIAGVSLCRMESWEHKDRGHVMVLGVRRPWRGQGLGEALLRHSFRAFQMRGYNKVDLGVDAQSLTGATRLYERVGMHVDQIYTSYEKEIRAGKEISTVTV